MSEESLNPTGPRKDSQPDDLLAGLGRLEPAVGRIDRDQFFFRAGQASAENAPTTIACAAPPHHAWRWPLTTAAAAILSAIVTLSVDRCLRPIEQIVSSESTPLPTETASVNKMVSPPPAFDSFARAEAPEDVPRSSSPRSYLALRRLIAARRIDFLPPPTVGEPRTDPPAAPRRSVQYRDLLNEYLPKL